MKTKQKQETLAHKLSTQGSQIWLWTPRILHLVILTTYSEVCQRTGAGSRPSCCPQEYLLYSPKDIRVQWSLWMTSCLQGLPWRVVGSVVPSDTRGKELEELCQPWPLMRLLPTLVWLLKEDAQRSTQETPPCPPVPSHLLDNQGNP